MCDLETEQEIEDFEEQIRNVKYDPILADFFSKYINDIEDLTK
jgi:hypothetical protein